MIIFNKNYSKQNLQDASNCACIPISRLIYKQNEQMNISDILFMYDNFNLFEMVKSDGLEFGFGKEMEHEILIDFLENKFTDSKFLRNKNNIDPIILINNRLFDGWKRCILAYALGQMVVECSLFESLPFENYLYFTEEDEINKALNIIKAKNLSNITEWMNQGLIVYFESNEKLDDFKKKIGIIQ